MYAEFYQVADDDDMDLFGEETEEEKKAAEERAASIKASSKKKESEFHLQSILDLFYIVSDFNDVLCLFSWVFV